MKTSEIGSAQVLLLRDIKNTPRNNKKRVKQLFCYAYQSLQPNEEP
jgi:hypothetical protein